MQELSYKTTLVTRANKYGKELHKFHNGVLTYQSTTNRLSIWYHLSVHMPCTSRQYGQSKRVTVLPIDPPKYQHHNSYNQDMAVIHGY